MAKSRSVSIWTEVDPARESAAAITGLIFEEVDGTYGPFDWLELSDSGTATHHLVELADEQGRVWTVFQPYQHTGYVVPTIRQLNDIVDIPEAPASDVPFFYNERHLELISGEIRVVDEVPASNQRFVESTADGYRTNDADQGVRIGFNRRNAGGIRTWVEG